MATKTPSQVADEYLLHLKGLKPDVNTDQTDSDWYVKSRVYGGVVSGSYADQRKISDDAFPQSARREAVGRHLNTYFNGTFNDATAASGEVLVTGASGTAVPVGLEFTYTPNGNTYQSVTADTLDGATGTAATGVVTVVSVAQGQAQNLLQGAVLSISSTPAGINALASVYGGDLGNGRNAETTEEAAARVLARIRNAISGGTESDYEQWATEASPSVTDVRVFRFIRGLGTVGVSIAAGTTDIDQAIDNGDAVVRIPTDDLVQVVEDYLATKKPLTDCVSVIKPTETSQDVTVNVKWADGYDGGSIPAGQILTLNQLLVREVGRALYKLPIGGREIEDMGYVLASEIEEAIDQKLSAAPYTEGTIGQFMADRQVQNLSATGVNRLLASNELTVPGAITIVEL